MKRNPAQTKKTAMPARIPLILAIDLEPDAFLLERNNPSTWSGCEAAFPVMAEFRSAAIRMVGGRPSFNWTLRMDPQIPESYSSADYLLKLVGKEIARAEVLGDEIGLHVHFWRWNESSTRWLVDHGNPAWVSHCLRESFASFRNAFGRPCRTYRSGDRWHDNESVRLVEELGVEFDLTLERGQPAAATMHPDAESTGSIADYARLPIYPFHPSHDDFREPDVTGTRSIWMFPLAGGADRFQPDWRRPWKRKVVEYVDPFRKIRSLYAPYKCSPAAPPTQFRERFDAYCAERGMSYVALAVRSNEFVNRERRDDLIQNLRYILRKLQDKGIELCTPARALDVLRG